MSETMVRRPPPYKPLNFNLFRNARQKAVVIFLLISWLREFIKPRTIKRWHRFCVNKYLKITVMTASKNELVAEWLGEENQ